MRYCLFLYCWVISYTPLIGQNYFGSGGNTSVTVTSSSTTTDNKWPNSAHHNNTIDGSGLNHEQMDAARFLSQASIGYDDSHITDVMNRGISGWIDHQINNVGTTDITSRLNSIWSFIKSINSEARRPGWVEFNYAWFDVIVQNPDLLRHRVATALTEILVISRNSEVGEYGDGMADYYDMLLQHAVGNYRDLLYDVSRHAMMGHYLSHANNPRSDTINGIHPDENYAREIMQLFSIGLIELNNNGTPKLDGQGNEIATYNNNDIKGLAKVFTGLGYADTVILHPDDLMYGACPRYFGMGLWRANVVEPMHMYNVDAGNSGDPCWIDTENMHEPGPKTFLGSTIPGGQSGLEDIDDAIDIIFNHPNVGPFLAYRLIQRMVKSNPSPAYVNRVANAFNGTGPYGAGRGNMASVVRAILLDEEARACYYQNDDSNARLREPLFRYTHFLRAVDKCNALNRYWNVNYGFYENTKQDIFASPSVFNFFLPTDRPNGDIDAQNLTAPEFKLHDSRTSVGYMNEARNLTSPWGSLMYTWLDLDPYQEGDGRCDDTDEVGWEISNLLPLAEDSEQYLNWLDEHILNGAMSKLTRETIRAAMNGYTVADSEYRENRISIGMHLALISPDYAITH